VIKLHIDAMVIFWFVVILSLLIVAKGARIKWLQDSGLITTSADAHHEVHVAPGANYIENYHAAPGDTSLLAQQSPGITVPAAPKAPASRGPGPAEDSQPRAGDDPPPSRPAS
jgi:hypothetical protein